VKKKGGLDGKYILQGVTGAEILRHAFLVANPGTHPSCNHQQREETYRDLNTLKSRMKSLQLQLLQLLNKRNKANDPKALLQWHHT